MSSQESAGRSLEAPAGAIPGQGSPPETGPAAIVDVSRIVADIQRRAAANRAAGAYDGALLDARFDLEGPGRGLSAVEAGAIRLRPELGYSSKPVVGSAITTVKRAAERLVHHVVQDGFDQAALGLEHLARSLEDIERRDQERVEGAIATMRIALDKESRRRQDLVEDGLSLLRAMESLGARVGELAERVERLEGPSRR